MIANDSDSNSWSLNDFGLYDVDSGGETDYDSAHRYR